MSPRPLEGAESGVLTEIGAAATGVKAAALGPTFTAGKSIGAILSGAVLVAATPGAATPGAETLAGSATSRRELGGGGASGGALAIEPAFGLWLGCAAGVTSADGTVDGVRSLFASGERAWVAVSGRTETGGGVLVMDDGRGAALTAGTLAGGMLGATGR